MRKEIRQVLNVAEGRRKDVLLPTEGKEVFGQWIVASGLSDLIISEDGIECLEGVTRILVGCLLILDEILPNTEEKDRC